MCDDDPKYTITINGDSDVEDPSHEEGSWTVYSFCDKHVNCEQKDRFFFDSGKAKPIVNRKLRVGLAFVLSYYEHGLGLWTVAGTGPQCQWDNTRFAGIAVWEDPPSHMGSKTYEDRKKDCAAFLEEYTDWCNGNCHWIQLVCSDPAQSIEPTIGGLIGNNSLINAIQEILPDDATSENTVFDGDGKYIVDYHDVFKKLTPA